MDDFFNKFKQGAFKAKDEAEKFTKTAVSKTKTAIDQTKYKYSISEFEGKIKNIMAELGEKLYKEYTEGTEFDEEIAEKCKMIDEFKEEIAQINAKIAELTSSSVCSQCGEIIPQDSVFCPKCGAKLD